MKTKNLTIMFTDIKGFTQKTSVYSRKQVDNFLSIQDNLFKPIIKKYNWNIIKTIWDAYLVSFESPTNAILCWMMFQNSVYIHNKNISKNLQSEKEFHVRIWINTWEVNIINWDVFWETVNIASRVECISEPDEVYFTQSTYLSMNKNEIPTISIWNKTLKWIPEEVKIYKVLKEESQIQEYFFTRKQNAEISWKFSKNGIDENIYSSEEKTHYLIYIYWFVIFLFIASSLIFYYKKYYLFNEKTIEFNFNNKIIEKIITLFDKKTISSVINNKTTNTEINNLENNNELKIKIHKYFILNNYKLIQDKKYQSSINNYSKKLQEQKWLNLKNFNNWYNDISKVNVKNFKNIEKNNYEFFLELISDNWITYTYKTNMLIDDIDWGLKIVFYTNEKL